MPEAVLVLLRLAQYAGAMILFGSSLFLLYALPRHGPAAAAALRWPRRLLAVGGLLTVVGALAGLVAQTATMAGSLAEAIKPASLEFMVTGTGIGRAAVVRAAAGALVLVALLVLRPGRSLWTLAAALGLVVAGSVAWMGHGAVTEGAGARLHLASDILHSLAAAVWLGALAAFLILLWPRRAGSPERTQALHASLHGFSGLGTALVAVLLGTGLVNSWFLVGPERISGLWTTDYGALLCAKLLLFVLMLALAAGNRFRLTPALEEALESGDAPEPALRRLKRSLLLESATGLAVLGLVAWLGTLAPVSAR